MNGELDLARIIAQGTLPHKDIDHLLVYRITHGREKYETLLASWNGSIPALVLFFGPDEQVVLRACDDDRSAQCVSHICRFFNDAIPDWLAWVLHPEGLPPDTFFTAWQSLSEAAMVRVITALITQGLWDRRMDTILATLSPHAWKSVVDRLLTPDIWTSLLHGDTPTIRQAVLPGVLRCVRDHPDLCVTGLSRGIWHTLFLAQVTTPERWRLAWNRACAPDTPMSDSDRAALAAIGVRLGMLEELVLTTGPESFPSEQLRDPAMRKRWVLASARYYADHPEKEPIPNVVAAFDQESIDTVLEAFRLFPHPILSKRLIQIAYKDLQHPSLQALVDAWRWLPDDQKRFLLTLLDKRAADTVAPILRAIPMHDLPPTLQSAVVHDVCSDTRLASVMGWLVRTHADSSTDNPAVQTMVADVRASHPAAWIACGMSGPDDPWAQRFLDESPSQVRAVLDAYALFRSTSGESPPNEAALRDMVIPRVASMIAAIAPAFSPSRAGLANTDDPGAMVRAVGRLLGWTPDIPNTLLLYRHESGARHLLADYLNAITEYTGSHPLSSSDAPLLAHAAAAVADTRSVRWDALFERYYTPLLIDPAMHAMHAYPSYAYRALVPMARAIQAHGDMTDDVRRSIAARCPRNAVLQEELTSIIGYHPDIERRYPEDQRDAYYRALLRDEHIVDAATTNPTFCRWFFRHASVDEKDRLLRIMHPAGLRAMMLSLSLSDPQTALSMFTVGIPDRSVAADRLLDAYRGSSIARLTDEEAAICGDITTPIGRFLMTVATGVRWDATAESLRLSVIADAIRLKDDHPRMQTLLIDATVDELIIVAERIGFHPVLTTAITSRYPDALSRYKRACTVAAQTHGVPGFDTEQIVSPAQQLRRIFSR